MSVTVSTSGDWTTTVGNKRQHYVSLAFDASYPTGGEEITARQVGLGVIDSMQIESSAGYVLTYDKANGKILAYYADYDDTSDGALIQVANAANLSAITAAQAVVTGV